MAKGISIHVGLNRVDPSHYQDENGQPWDGALKGCENDARDMQKIAKKRGFATQLLLNDAATAEAVQGAIVDAAKTLKKGDILLLTYAGHGGQVADRNGDEGDDYDETWCLYDRQLVDDELYALWGRFPKGVRILMVSDSCHSGSVSRAPGLDNALRMAGARVRMMSRPAAERTYRTHRKVYDGIQRDLPLGDKQPVQATVVLVSGCQDNQFSGDGDANGLFTETLKKVWRAGRFTKGLPDFHKAIVKRMPPWQAPNYFVVGAANPAFEAMPPFTI